MKRTKLVIHTIAPRHMAIGAGAGIMAAVVSYGKIKDLLGLYNKKHISLSDVKESVEDEFEDDDDFDDESDE